MGAEKRPLSSEESQASECEQSPPVFDFDSSFTQGLGDELVYIYAGSEERKMSVHKMLISKFKVFEILFNGPFKEGIDGTARLIEDHEPTVAWFIEWLYRRDCGLFHLAMDENNESFIFQELLILYVFAAKYNVTPLMHDAADNIRDYYRNNNRKPSADHMAYLYNHTTGPCGLRRYVVQCLRWAITERDGSGPWTTDYLFDAIQKTPDLARDLIEVLRGSNGARMMNPANTPHCVFNECPSGKEYPRKRNKK